ncbi:hypothetical protein [Vibrio sp. 10N.261.51.F12]|uniref:hypothetical protein n=1 Tax=Vibrio sp. 10N.261.51.F12 TaxID=3229679 RepID=UPI0035515A34
MLIFSTWFSPSTSALRRHDVGLCVQVLLIVASIPLSFFFLHYLLESAIARMLTHRLPELLQQASVNSVDAHALVLSSSANIKTFIEGLTLHNGLIGQIVNTIKVLEISLTQEEAGQFADVRFMFDQRLYAIQWSLKMTWHWWGLAPLLIVNPISMMTVGFLFLRSDSALSAEIITAPARVETKVASDVESILETPAIDEPSSDIPPKNTITRAMRHDTDHLPICDNEEELLFELATQSIVIGGGRVVMPKTPFFYYLWYAKRQLEGLPPYVNPSMHQPDKQAGQELAQLMRGYGGHARAINDLEHFGLRAKTLDQNRNKIKDELTNALGHKAKDFLFCKTRHAKTGRYQYQLVINKSLIKQIDMS